MDNKNVWPIIIDKLIDNINLSTDTNDLIKKTTENYKKIISELNLQLQFYKKSLELACKHIAIYSDSCYYCPKKQYCDEDCDFDWGDNDCIDWLMNYFNKQAKEQLKDE